MQQTDRSFAKRILTLKRSFKYSFGCTSNYLFSDMNNNSTGLALNLSRSESEISISRPDCYTAVAWRIYLTKKQNLILSICYGSTVIPVVVLNSFLCYALSTQRQWKKQSKVLIFLLSVSDALMGFLSIPGTIILTSIFSHQRHCLIERLVVFFGQANGHFSFYISLAIATQRFVKLQCSYLGMRIFTRISFTESGMTTILWCVFLLSCAHGLVSTYFFGLVSTPVPNIVMMVLRGIILVLIQFCYYRVYIGVKNHIKRNPVSNGNESMNSGQKNENQRPNKALYSKTNRTVLCIMVLLVLSYLPATVADIWTGYYSLFLGTEAPILPRFAFYLSFTTIFLNCALNAAVIIYHDWRSLGRVYSA